MKPDRWLVPLGFVLTCSIWGSTWLVIKVGLASVPPLFGVALRFTLALLILISAMAIRRKWLPVDRNSVILYSALGVFSYALPYALVYWSEQYIPSGLASVLFAVYPFVVVTFSHFFLPHEELTRFKLAGIILGFIGILF